MLNLRIQEDLQDRVFSYYEEMSNASFVNSKTFYDLISTAQSDEIKMHQISKSVNLISFLNPNNTRQIEEFVRRIEIWFYLTGDIILKQGVTNNYLYYIHKGLVEVILENTDFEYFNFK